MHCTPHHHHHHHHCINTNTNTNTTTIAYIASTSAASRNRGTRQTSSSSSCLCCSCCGYLRYLLVFLGLVACAIDYMVRFNISVTIVSMVHSAAQDVNSSYACPAAFNTTRETQNTTGGGEYYWSAQEQGIVLGTFFWGYLITKTVGGRIAEILGPTFTVTVTVGLCGVLTLLTPSVAAIHPLALAALRFVMGLLQGPIFPAIYSIISRWSLPGEATTMMAVAYSGQALGALVSLGLSGIVISSLGWRWVFWGGGILTLAWVPFWVCFVRDSPRQHSGISNRELQRLSANRNQPRKKVPWSRILKSRQLYLLIMMEFVNVWIQGIIISEGPTYMITQIGMDLQKDGIVNLVLMGVTLTMCYVYGWLSDLIQRREWLSVINIRRLAQGFGLVISVSSMTGLAVVGCNATLVTVFFILQCVGIPFALSSYMMGPMDIAPNYAGTISGMVGCGTLGGFLFPLFSSYFMDKKNGWRIIFLVSGSLYGLASILYIIGVTATEAEWNIYEEIQGDSEEPAATKKVERRGRK